jgi:hypothetical protein
MDACPHNNPGCPGPSGYDVDDFDSGICMECEVAAMAAEPIEEHVYNRFGRLVCDFPGCARVAGPGGRCERHPVVL